MASVAQSKSDDRPGEVAAWLPLLGLPTLVVIIGAAWPAGILFWSLAVSIYAGFKWLTFAHSSEAWKAPWGRQVGYLLLWPGMDAEAFMDIDRLVPRPALSEWMWSIAKTIFGVFVLFGATPFAAKYSLFVAGWVGIVGIGFTLHFGLVHLVSVVWREAGVAAEPIMKNPLKAKSVSDFWGSRWNLAVRDLMHNYLFRPVSRRWGVATTMLVAFLISGIVHDLVMSSPAAGGYGLPTLYFGIQGFALRFERSRLGKWIGLGRGVLGRLFAAVVTVGPMGLLFHPPFVHRVIFPTLTALGAM